MKGVFFTFGDDCQIGSHRVATRQGKVREKCFFSRSGKCQGILKFVREKFNFGKCHGKLQGKI